MLVFGVKNIGFLSFGHCTDHPESGTRNASDALLQAIDLAVAAEELGADGAYFRVHHFAQQYARRGRLLGPVPPSQSSGCPGPVLVFVAGQDMG
jgi:alkanesulfonate monooxygenase SsuD/methylene tetrahydromethanopterin reductase-like flavin-dependent oxidoreductase (luciferase family)